MENQIKWHTDWCMLDGIFEQRDIIEKAYPGIFAHMSSRIKHLNDGLDKYRIIMEIAASSFASGQKLIEMESVGASAEALYSNTNLMHEYLWKKIGAPRWFISAEMADLLRHTQVDDEDLTGIRWPWDVFRLVFEYGTTIDGWPLRWIQAAPMRSDLSMKILQHDMGVTLKGAGDKAIKLTAFRIDVGEVQGSGEHRIDTPPVMSTTLDLFRHDATANMGGATQPGISEKEKQVEAECVRLAVAAVLYWNARPEFFKDYTLPRSCRYQFKQRDHCKRIQLPLEKYVRPPSEHLPGWTGRTMPPHFRGGVLRTLRHERFKRNDDGSLKVIWVEPCAIHPELMNLTDGRTTAGL